VVLPILDDALKFSIALTRSEIYHAVENVIDGTLRMANKEYFQITGHQIPKDIWDEVTEKARGIALNERIFGATLEERLSQRYSKFYKTFRNRLKQLIAKEQDTAELITELIPYFQAVQRVPGGSVFYWSDLLLVDIAHRVHWTTMKLLALEAETPLGLGWVAVDECERCRRYDGQTFRPKELPEYPHPYCNCEIELKELI
jgi:hypothetical protein